MHRSPHAVRLPVAPAHLARIALISLLAVGGLGLIAALFAGLGQAHDRPMRLEPVPLAAACALGLVYWLIGAVAWWATLSRLGERLPLRTGLGIFFIANLGRYVPGKVWFALGRTYLAREHGVPANVGATSVVLELALIAVSGAVITIAGAPFLALSGVSPAWFGVGIAATGLIALHSRVLGLALAVVARVSHTRAPPAPSYRVMLPLLALYTGAWLVAGAALFATLAALTPVSWEMLPPIFGVWGVAFLTGFVAPITPAGVGVREATGTVALATIVPLPTAAAAMILFRVVLTGAELACVLPHAPTLVRALRGAPAAALLARQGGERIAP